MNENEKLQLQKLIKMNNVEDQTQQIRNLKHSQIIKKDIETLLLLKEKITDKDELLSKAMYECGFLFTYYTDIYNRIKNDEIDISLLFTFLEILSKIENEELDQHEGSFMIGKILKEMYIDSALKKSEKLDKLYSSDVKETNITPIQIQWKQWKSQYSS
jgi:predicted transcriptional regulator